MNLSPELPAYEVAVPNVAQVTEFVKELTDCISNFPVSFKDNTPVPIKYSLGDIIDHRH